MWCPWMCSNMITGTSGIILAGGKSTRMGGPNKAELPFHGMTLLLWQEEKLRKMGIGEILISGYGKYMIPDDIPGKGPLGGLYSALRRASAKQCLVLPVDVPLVPQKALEELIRMHRGGITILESEGKIEPLIGVYDAGLAESILPMLQSGSTSVRRLLDLRGYRTVPFSGPSEFLTNCNTPEAYEIIRSL